MENASNDIFSSDDIVHAYTRAQAIEDGVLVELPPDLCRQAGIVVPVAVTSEVYAIIEPTAKEYDLGQSFTGRAWDLLWMGSLAMRRAGRSDAAVFRSDFLLCSDREGATEQESKEMTFIAKIGADDAGAPAITIMLPGQD